MILRPVLLAAFCLGTAAARAEPAAPPSPGGMADGPAGYAGSQLYPVAPPRNAAPVRPAGFASGTARPAAFWATGLLAPGPLPAAPRGSEAPPAPHSGDALQRVTPYAAGGIGCDEAAAGTSRPGRIGQRTAYKLGAGLRLPGPASGSFDIGYRFCARHDLGDLAAPATLAPEEDAHRLHIGYRMRF